MKTYLLAIIAVLFCSGVAVADHHEGEKGKAFAEIKAKVVENTQKRIDSLTTMKSCISSAADRAAMKKCRETHKTAMQGVKDEMKAMREERKAKRAARKAAKGK